MSVGCITKAHPDRETRAMEYIAKCEGRRSRAEKRRNARIKRANRYVFPFAIGLFSMACVLAILV